MAFDVHHTGAMLAASFNASAKPAGVVAKKTIGNS